MDSSNARVAQGQRTVRRIVEVATTLFAQKGYAAVASEEVVELAGVTRGALYHHFDGKKGLFREVFRQAHTRVAERIAAAAEQETDLWLQLEAGCRAFIEAATDPALARILLLDAPAVLGWNDWRRVDEENSLRDLRFILGELIADGRMRATPLEATARLLSGAMNEAALWAAEADDRPAALAETHEALGVLLRSLAKPSTAK